MLTTIQSNLHRLYKNFEKDIYNTGDKCTGSMNGPFLINPNQKYTNANIKIAFIGQETRGWSSNKSIENQMDSYLNFNLGKNYYSSPFWNVIRKIEKSINQIPYESAWLNINRYDENKGKPSDDNLSTLSEIDYLLLSELEILKPDITIFLTGHSYDKRVLSILNGSIKQINNFSTKKLCRIESNKIHGKVFRTYHPNYLRRSGLETPILNEIHTELSK